MAAVQPLLRYGISARRPRNKGGFEGELDVVAVHVTKPHLLHVECSVDADSWQKSHAQFALKLEREAK